MKKKLLFFLLTVVCTLLCAPPATSKVIFFDKTDSWGSFNVVIGGTNGGSYHGMSNANGNILYYDLGTDAATKVAFAESGWSDKGNTTVDCDIVPLQIYKASGWLGSGLQRTVTTSFPTVHIHQGSGKNWETSTAMTRGADGKYTLNNYQFTAGNQFGVKIMQGNTQLLWISCNESGQTPTTSKSLKVEGKNLYSPATGKYNVVFDPAAMTIVVNSAQDQVATPTFSVADNSTVAYNTEVTISCATTGAKIYYTTDGNNPTTSSTQYTTPIKITSDVTIKAIAVKEGMDDSETVQAKYTLAYDFSQNVVKPHTMKVKFTTGYGDERFDLTLKDGIWSSAEITPSKIEDGKVWFQILPDNDNDNAFHFSSTKTAVNDTWQKNQAKKESGDYSQEGLSSAKKYIVQLKASDGNNSDFDWRIISGKEKVATPSFDPESGEASSVTISCATDGAAIYYTTNGSTPSASSTLYSSAISITSATTIKAIAIKEGMTDSEVATSSFTVPAERVTYTVYADISALNGGNQWTNENVHAFFKGVTGVEHTWTGVQGVLENGVLKFTVESTSVPTGVVFNNNDKTNDSKQTEDLQFENGKLYKLNWNGPGKNLIADIVTYTPPVPVNYTIYVDVSNVLGSLWDASKVHVCFKRNNSTMNGWPGSVGTAYGNIVTIKYTANYVPEKVIINNGQSNQSNQTTELDFHNNKLYVLQWNGFDANLKADITDYTSPVLPTVNLPYGPEDFDNGPKYFLVGARMGEWRLQPEWELIKQSNGTYKTKAGRFMFYGHFGVAKVDNYADYIYHRYELIISHDNDAKVETVNGGNITVYNMNVQDAAFYYNKHVQVYKWYSGQSDYNAAMAFCKFNGYERSGDQKADIDRIWRSTNDKGLWCEAITYNPTAKTLVFSGIDETNNGIENRVFTLVGSQVRHSQYENERTTPLGQKGWQDSWIQYDANGQPYYDADGHYLYHTAYTPDILENAAVKFRINVNGKDWDYSSSAITFIEANKLPKLNEDRYKDLYKFFEGNKALANGMQVKDATGKGFNFILSGIPEAADSKPYPRNYDNDKNNWKVFVVRDAWVDDQFLIWNGWGGNRKKAEGFNEDSQDARWNVLNAGPSNWDYEHKSESDNVTKKYTKAKIINLHAGTEQDLNQAYIDQGADYNYKVDGLTYFNRILLLYNTGYEDALKNSVVLFIQDDTQPEIKAYLKETTNGNKTAYSSYVDWKLINISNPAAIITSYTITRYNVTDDGLISPKVVTNEKNFGKTASELSDDQRVNYSEILNSGSYRYRIVVNYEIRDNDGKVTDSGSREAYSNDITVYGNDVTPQLRIEQLVVLNKAGYDAIMNNSKVEGDNNSYNKIKASFTSEFGSTISYSPNKFYLTYRENNEMADHYAIYTTSNDVNPDITKMAEVDAKEVIAFMEHPEYYTWAARFYVRVLDYDEYKRKYSRMNVQSSEPTIVLTDEAGVQVTTDSNNAWNTNSSNISTAKYTVTKDGQAKHYIGTIVDRKGFLKPGNMIADMTYSYGTHNETNDTWDHSAETSHTVEFTPVVPKPYNLTAWYEYRPVPFGNPFEEALGKGNLAENFEGYLKVKTKSRINPNHQNSDKDQAYEILAPVSQIDNERHLDAVFQFYAPNVSEDIYSHYNIEYTIHVNTVEDGATVIDKQGGYSLIDIKGTYYDPAENAKSVDATTGEPKSIPYQIRISDTHPSGNIYPEFQINSVVYERDEKLVGDIEKEEYRRDAEYDYGSLYANLANSPAGKLEIKQLGMGWNPPSDNDPDAGYRWFLYSHTHLNYEGTTPDEAFVDTPEFANTKLYMIELSHNGEYRYGNNLWVHNHGTSKTEVVEDTPLYIASMNTAFDTNGNLIVPDVAVTPIYLFIRTMTDEAVSSSEVEIRDLTPVKPGTTNAPKRVIRRAGEQAATTFQIPADAEIVTTTDGNGKIVRAEYDASGHNELVVMPGNVVQLAKENSPIMTGIEDVINDGANGAEAVYYNLQGIQVAHPVPGQIYIRRTGKTTEKIVF